MSEVKQQDSTLDRVIQLIEKLSPTEKKELLSSLEKDVFSKILDDISAKYSEIDISEEEIIEECDNVRRKLYDQRKNY